MLANARSPNMISLTEGNSTNKIEDERGLVGIKIGVCLNPSFPIKNRVSLIRGSTHKERSNKKRDKK